MFPISSWLYFILLCILYLLDQLLEISSPETLFVSFPLLMKVPFSDPNILWNTRHWNPLLSKCNVGKGGKLNGLGLLIHETCRRLVVIKARLMQLFLWNRCFCLSWIKFYRILVNNSLKYEILGRLMLYFIQPIPDYIPDRVHRYGGDISLYECYII